MANVVLARGFEMVDGGIEWAGYSFLALGHHDARFIREAGVFALVKRAGSDRIMLYAGEAEDISRAVGPAHPNWAAALNLGLSELHVFTRPRDRLERLLVLDRVVRRCLPLLNLIEAQAQVGPTPPTPIRRQTG